MLLALKQTTANKKEIKGYKIQPRTDSSLLSPAQFIDLIGFQHRGSSTASLVLIGCLCCQLQQLSLVIGQLFSPRTFYVACLTTLRGASLFSIGQSGCLFSACSEMIGSCCRARDFSSVTCLAVRGWGLFLMYGVVPPLSASVQSRVPSDTSRLACRSHISIDFNQISVEIHAVCVRLRS